MATVLEDSLFCVLLQKLMYSFWEKIAADVLQPDLSKGLEPYITQMLGLHNTGRNFHPLCRTLILTHSFVRTRSAFVA